MLPALTALPSKANMIILLSVVRPFVYYATRYSSSSLGIPLVGGTAGCVLASRLSEDPTVKVLLLERGNARLGWSTRVPLLSTNFMGDDDAAYKWPSTPTPDLSNSRSLNMVTGKGLGGGSAINSMQYTRGYPQEFDLWSNNGRKGWSFNEVEEYFKKSEKFVSVPERACHGSNGTRFFAARFYSLALSYLLILLKTIQVNGLSETWGTFTFLPRMRN